MILTYVSSNEYVGVGGDYAFIIKTCVLIEVFIRDDILMEREDKRLIKKCFIRPA